MEVVFVLFFLVIRDALMQLTLNSLIPSSVFPRTVVEQHTKAQGWLDTEVFCRALGARHSS